MTVIAEARHTFPDPQTHGRDLLQQRSPWNVSKHAEDSHDRQHRSRAEEMFDQAESSNLLTVKHSPGSSQSGFPALTESYNADLSEETIKGGPAYPPFPCPFCDRAYTSWGFRRRHIKAVHTISPSLNCKWCLQVSLMIFRVNLDFDFGLKMKLYYLTSTFLMHDIFYFHNLQVLPTHAAWRRHVISTHNLSANDAHNGLLILEEAHMVLQIARPTRLDTLVKIIKQSSQQNNSHDTAQSDKD